MAERAEDPKQETRRRPIRVLGAGELVFSVIVCILFTLPVAVAFVGDAAYRDRYFHLHQAVSALRDLVAEIEHTANVPSNLETGQGIGAVLDKYDGRAFPAGDVPSGEIRVACFADETAVPEQLGGPRDLNLDGDAEDDLRQAGFDLKIIPVELTLTFPEGESMRRLVLHRLVTRTAR